MGFFSKSQIKRIEDRQPTFGFVEVRTESGVPLAQATLRDTSKFGAMIRSTSQRNFPERVNLWFPKEQIDVSASVRWSEGGDMGVQFDHSLECWDKTVSRRNRLDVVTTHLERAGI